MKYLADHRHQITEIWQVSGNRRASEASLLSASCYLLPEATGRSA